MISKAISRYNRISPKKARLLTRHIKGMTVAEAYAVLGAVNKKASYLIFNVLKSAFSNAHKNDTGITESDVYISKIAADSGPSLKRHRAASMGRASLIRKRTSHFTVQLEVKGSYKKAQHEIKSAKRHGIFRKKARAEKEKFGGRFIAADKKKK